MYLPFCKWLNIINFIWFNLIAKGREIGEKLFLKLKDMFITC